MGNGQNTSSWKDLWLEFGLLKDRYEILFLTHNVGIGYMECGYRGGIGERSFFNGKDKFLVETLSTVKAAFVKKRIGHLIDLVNQY